MNRRLWIAGGLAVLLAFSLVFTAWATDAQLFFSRDKSGQDRVTSVNEGDSIWIVVNDPDQDTDCDARDKIWTDVKVMDAKTGAHIVWKSYLNADGDEEYVISNPGFGLARNVSQGGIFADT